MVCALEMRGTDSMAKPVTPATRSRPARSGRVRGARNPVTMDPGFSSVISSSVGGFTFTTTSAGHGLPMVAPASTYRSSAIKAPAPAPASTTTERPVPHSRSTTLGTSATRRSPGTVSLGTPISVIFLFQAVAGQNAPGGSRRCEHIAYCMHITVHDAGRRRIQTAGRSRHLGESAICTQSRRGNPSV